MDRVQKLTITQGLIHGLPQNEIARRAGVDDSAVTRYKQKEQVKAIIEAGQRKIAAKALKPAIDNMVALVQDYKTQILDPENKAELQKKDHGFKMTVKVLESHGLVGAAPSHTVNAIYVQDNRQFISPLIDRALQQAMSIPQDVVVDSENDDDSV